MTTSIRPHNSSRNAADGLVAPFALGRFSDAGRVRTGVVADGRIRALGRSELGLDGLNGLLARDDCWDRVARAAETEGDWRELSSVSLTAPVAPRQVIQTGANYRDHVIDLLVARRLRAGEGTEAELRAWAADTVEARVKSGKPYFLYGLPACVVGDDVDLILPDYSDEHDWELELAVVVGRGGFRIARDRALEHVAGYTISNDITTRDLVFVEDMKELGTDWFRSKNAPGFLPTGPLLVPAPFVEDPGDLTVTLSLNGEIMQNQSTRELLFDVPALLSAASQFCALQPGDLLLTGSPAGNGAAVGRFLRRGDVMVGSITGLGTQAVRCADPTPATKVI